MRNKLLNEGRLKFPGLGLHKEFDNVYDGSTKHTSIKHKTTSSAASNRNPAAVRSKSRSNKGKGNLTSRKGGASTLAANGNG